jgi:hypothetical protein
LAFFACDRFPGASGTKRRPGPPKVLPVLRRRRAARHQLLPSVLRCKSTRLLKTFFVTKARKTGVCIRLDAKPGNRRYDFPADEDNWADQSSPGGSGALKVSRSKRLIGSLTRRRFQAPPKAGSAPCVRRMTRAPGPYRLPPCDEGHFYGVSSCPVPTMDRSQGGQRLRRVPRSRRGGSVRRRCRQPRGSASNRMLLHMEAISCSSSSLCRRGISMQASPRRRLVG